MHIAVYAHEESRILFTGNGTVGNERFRTYPCRDSPTITSDEDVLHQERLQTAPVNPTAIIVQYFGVPDFQTRASLILDTVTIAVLDSTAFDQNGLPLADMNPTSQTYQQNVAPTDYIGWVSGWYFGHST